MDWSNFSLKKIEGFLLENDVLAGYKIGNVNIDADIVNSWKSEVFMNNIVSRNLL